MPRVALTVTTATHDGVTLPAANTSVPASDHEILNNDGYIIVIAENISTSTRTIVIDAAATFGVPAIPLVDRTKTIAPGARAVFGPFSRRLFNQAGDGSTASVLVNVDGVNGEVELLAIQVPIAVT